MPGSGGHAKVRSMSEATRRRLGLGVGVLLTALLLSACGGSGGAAFPRGPARAACCPARAWRCRRRAGRPAPGPTAAVRRPALRRQCRRLTTARALRPSRRPSRQPRASPSSHRRRPDADADTDTDRRGRGRPARARARLPRRTPAHRRRSRPRQPAPRPPLPAPPPRRSRQQPAPVAAEESTDSLWWLWLLVALALAGGIAWFVLARRRSSADQSEDEPDDPAGGSPSGP